MRSLRVAGCATLVLLFGMSVSGCGTLGAVDRALGQVVDAGLKAADSAAKKATRVDKAKKNAEAQKRAYESRSRQQKQNFNKANKNRGNTQKTSKRRHHHRDKGGQ